MIVPYKEIYPNVEQALFIAANATIVGDVTLGSDTTVWYSATLRGDMAPITIGRGTNVQDNAVIHVNNGMPTHLGENITVGHGAILHAWTIGSGTLVGMGAIVLDGATVGEDSLVAAGAVVPPNKSYPPRSLLMGSPAKVVRELTAEELEGMATNVAHYIELGEIFKLQEG
ncbi:MAG: gamma carbonic anhydrase family protein [Spirochaetales bacterium]|nr:gamma carbonic anhydrase family protein [Spirochaetales bacterium]